MRLMLAWSRGAAEPTPYGCYSYKAIVVLTEAAAGALRAVREAVKAC